MMPSYLQQKDNDRRSAEFGALYQAAESIQYDDKKQGSDVQKKLTIVIPAFNEENIIGQVLGHIQDLNLDFLQEIIVVDDGSTDDTGRISEEAGVRVIHHTRNMGYGSAIKSGIRNAQTEFILTMDADGQHRADDILKLWDLVARNDMVVGARASLIHSSLWRMPGKWILGKMAGYLTRRKIPDLNSGFRLIRRDVALRYLHLCPSGFSLSTTLTMVLLSQGHNVTYIPIQIERRTGKSTVSIITGFDTIILILRIASLINPLRIFVPLSILIGLAGILWGLPIILEGRGVSVGTMLAIFTSILLFSLGLLCDQISQLRLEQYK